MLELLSTLGSRMTPLHLVGASLCAYLALVVCQAFFVFDRIKYRHVPGPSPTPILGNLHTVGWHYKQLLFVAFAEWRQQYGKVFKWFCGQHTFVVIADPELLRLVCVKHFRVFHDRHLMYSPQPRAITLTHASGLPFSKGALWSSIKSSLQPLVHSDGLASAVKVTSRAVAAATPILREAARSGKSIDMHSLTSSLSLRVISGAAFGLELDTLTTDPKARAVNNVLVEAAEQSLHYHASTLWTATVPMAVRPIAWPLLSAFPNKGLARLREGRSRLYMGAKTLAKNAMDRIGAEWKDEVNMERDFDTPGSRMVADLYKTTVPCERSAIDLLVRAKNKDTGASLKTHHIVAQANSILVGGHDTTSFTLTAALFFLATHPEAQAVVLAEVDAFGRDKLVTGADLAAFPYLDAVMRESLRLLPPVWITTREATEDITVNGIYMPKGTVVYIDLYGMHRDPEQFPEPLSFKPERFYNKDSEEAKNRHPYAWSGFGQGPRMCLGYKLATQEVEQVLVSLFQRFTFELDPAMTKLGPDGLPPLQSGIHLQFAGGVYFNVHERMG